MRSSRRVPSALGQILIWLLAVGVVAILAAGCGESQATTTPRAAFPPARPQPTATPALPLTQRLAFIPGFHGIQLPAVIQDPSIWEADQGLVGSQLRQVAGRLKRLDFIAAVRERLYGQRRSDVEILSVVERFRSTADARSELAERGARPSGGVQQGVLHSSFAVNGIPGAVGNETRGPLGTSQAVAFIAGPFYYRLAVTTPSGASPGPDRQQVIAACASLFRRVHDADSV